MTDITIFDKILSGEIPCKKVYEDAFTLAFEDIHPVAPVHVLVIPKKKLKNIFEATDTDAEIMGRILLTAQKVAHIKGISETGCRLVMNNGAASGQTVFYMHCHVIGGGHALPWPP